MEEELPLVSVLMTAYNREKYIAEAIESVLASTYINFELIIVDDGSTDKTVQIAESYAIIDRRIKVYVNEKNLGDYQNRNKAASYAKGKYLKYVDSDDLIYPYGLETMVNAMEKFPEAALGITSKNIIPLQPFPILLTPQEAYHKHFFVYGLLDYGPTGVIIRTEIFKANNMFSGKRYIGDTECWLKITAVNCVVELPPALTFWRQHEGQELELGVKSIDEGYFLMNLPLLREVLSNPLCPLNEREKKIILKKQNKIHVRSLAKHLIMTKDFKKVSNLFFTLKLSFKGLF